MTVKSNDDLTVVRDALLEAKAPVAILSHPFPDGDSIGSTLGAYRILTAAGLRVEAVLNSLPESYRFLAEGVKIQEPPIDIEGKIALVLDCGDVQRLRQAGHSLAGAIQVINIDHHPDNEHYGDLNFVDDKAAAVGEILYRMFEDHVHRCGQAGAEALYTAMFTDTGRFSYGNTTARTLRSAAALVALGASPHRVYRHLYQNRTRAYLNFLSQALALIEVHCRGKVSLLPLERSLLDRFQLEDWELEEINDYPRSLAGVCISAVLRETEPGVVKVSLRSKGWDVASIARDFGGGGHRNAAGAKFCLSMEEARARLLLRLGEEGL